MTVTLERYLDTLSGNPLDEDSPPLVWHKDFIPKDEAEKAGPLPYAVVVGLDENERARTHAKSGFWDQLIFVRLYQKPAGNTPPDEAIMQDLYRMVLEAPKHVNSAGKYRHFMRLERSGGQPPQLDEKTRGLWALCSFRLHFFIP